MTEDFDLSETSMAHCDSCTRVYPADDLPNECECGCTDFNHMQTHILEGDAMGAWMPPEDEESDSGVCKYCHQQSGDVEEHEKVCDLSRWKCQRCELTYHFKDIANNSRCACGGDSFSATENMVEPPTRKKFFFRVSSEAIAHLFGVPGAVFKGMKENPLYDGTDFFFESDTHGYEQPEGCEVGQAQCQVHDKCQYCGSATPLVTVEFHERDNSFDRVYTGYSTPSGGSNTVLDEAMRLERTRRDLERRTDARRADQDSDNPTLGQDTVSSPSVSGNG